MRGQQNIKRPGEDLGVSEDITEWGRNLQNKTFYKFACSGQRPGGLEDNCAGIQVWEDEEDKEKKKKAIYGVSFP